MQQSDKTIALLDDVVIRGNLAARRIADGLEWGEGSIQSLARMAEEGKQRELIGAVLENIVPVSPDEAAYSSCTDGRLPLRLANGEKVPVREQVVGADIVSAFFVAECLGARFYREPKVSVAERIADVAAFLRENGLLPSSHLACGAAGGFVTILQNIVRFSRIPAYLARLQQLLPEGVFDAALYRTFLKSVESRLQSNAYQGLDAEIFLRAAENAAGQRAIAELKDDGRGVRGHVEQAIVRLRVPGKAIDEAQVAEDAGGRQVFGVNDTRMERLAHLFARGNDQDYRLAAMALEAFASCSHATLAKNLPTYIVTTL